MNKPIPGTDGFTIDTDGNVFDSNGKLKNTYLNGDGYVTVGVRLADGRWTTIGIHRLLALTYIPNTNPLRIEINHRNGIIKNNDISNLEWVTPYENNIHSELLFGTHPRPRLAILRSGEPYSTAINLSDAERITGLDMLRIWDCVKDGTSDEHFSFVYLPKGAKPPKELRSYRERDPNNRGVKIRNIETGEVRVYESFKEASSAHNTTTSHIHQSIQTGDTPKILQRKFQVTYPHMDFVELTQSQIEAATESGSKEVFGMHIPTGKQLVTASAAAFVRETGLSRKAVTVALANNRIREIDSWVFTYLTKENVNKLLTHVGCPITT